MTALLLNVVVAGGVKVIVWLAGVTVSICSTEGAALKLALPGCAARIVAVPAPRSVAELPEMVTTLVVRLVKLTANPEFEVAANGTVLLGAKTWLLSALKVIAWEALTLVNRLVSGRAAL